MHEVLLKRLTQQQQEGNCHFQMLQPPQQQAPPCLKCPRCDSLNTKFCYYNNYNLSQPRHFCKNCRRYWTKGGVLRNVPVGGGCRKSKRSSSSSNKFHKSSSNHSKSATVTVNSHSSSESSSATATATTTTDATGNLFNIIPEVENFGISSDLFSGGEIQGFINLISENNTNKNDEGNNNRNNNNNQIGNVVSTASFSEYLQSQGIQEWDMGKICGGVHGLEKITGAVDLVNPTDRIEDLLQSRGSNVGLATLDWHLTVGNNNNQGNLFDVADNSSTVDPHHHQGYWGESTVDDHYHHHHGYSTSSHLPLFLP